MKGRYWFVLAVTLLLFSMAAGPLSAQDDITAVVATGRLNVRDAPVFLLGRVLTQIDRGEAYPVVGRNLDGTWAQIDVKGTPGWVNARHIYAPGLQDAPISASAAAAGIINARVQTGRLNVRDYPHHAYGYVLTTIMRNTIWPITGRNEDSTWAQLDLYGTPGWVNTRYLLAPDLAETPQLEMNLEDLPNEARVNTGRLNVRHIPNFFGGEVLAKLWRGEEYPVLARNFDSSWAQLDVNGEPGWVNARYIEAPRLDLAPLSASAFAAEEIYFARVDTGRLNVRAKPLYPSGQVLTSLPRGHIVAVLGRNASATWLQVDYDYRGEGAVGWMNARYMNAPDKELAPITLYG